MNTKGKKISEFISWLFKSYQELELNRQLHISHKVISHEQDENGRYIVVVQMIGRNLSYKIKPEEILADDHVTECFTVKDIRAISYLACENLKAPKYEILGQKFRRDVNKYFFKVRHHDTGEEAEKSAEEISADPLLINSLTPDDAHKIGYITANEQVKYEAPKHHEFIGQRFSRNLNKFFFTFVHRISGEQIEKSAEEISKDLNLLNAMKPVDAHKIGFVTANEQIKNDLQHNKH